MSDILDAVNKTAKGLHKYGAIDKAAMLKFDTLSLTAYHDFTGEQIRDSDMHIQYCNENTGSNIQEQNASDLNYMLLKINAENRQVEVNFGMTGIEII